MSYADKVFLQNCQDILANGTWDTNQAVRTKWDDGTPAHTIKLFGVVNRYNLSKEFPILTVRRQYPKSAIDELLWIWQKKSNDIHQLSSHVWDQWADKNGTIGKAYGYQYGQKYRVARVNDGMLRDLRNMFGDNSIYTANVFYSGQSLHEYVQEKGTGYHAVVAAGYIWMDQVDSVLYNLRYNRANRRIIATAWNKADAADMALEPCAYSMTFNVVGDKLNAILNQRSQDMLAANGWNVMQYAALVMMMAQVSGLRPGELVHVIADCHIYDRHVPMIKELLENVPYPAPKVVLDPSVKDFYAFTKNSFNIKDYQFSELEEKIPVAI